MNQFNYILKILLKLELMKLYILTFLDTLILFGLLFPYLIAENASSAAAPSYWYGEEIIQGIFSYFSNS